MDQLLNPCRSTILHLPAEQRPIYEIVLNEMQDWKMIHPSIIGLICGQYPNDVAKRSSIYLNILASGAGQKIVVGEPSNKRRHEADSNNSNKTFKSNMNERPQTQINTEKIGELYPVMDGHLLIGASNLRRMAEFQLNYKKDETGNMSNQIGTCVGGWRIENMTGKINSIKNIEKILVMPGTNDIVNNCDEDSLGEKLQALSKAIEKNKDIKEAIILQPPPLPYHSRRHNELVQEIPEIMKGLAQTNSKIKVVDTWKNFTDDDSNFKVELFTFPGSRFSTSIHLNKPGTLLLKRLITKAIGIGQVHTDHTYSDKD